MQMNLKISKYHKKQHKKIYRSTELFIKFIEKYEKLNNKTILDLGCGAGANTIYLAKKYKNSNFIGIDRNLNAIKYAQNMVKKYKIKNCKFISGNILNLKKKPRIGKIDIAISFHFLSFVSEWYDITLGKICSLKPNSTAHSSLFFEGLAEAKIDVNDFSKSELKKSPYNIFSLTKIKNFLIKKKYKFFRSKQMVIDKKIIKPRHKGMGSYTLKLRNGKLELRSGPLRLPHGFFYASKKN